MVEQPGFVELMEVQRVEDEGPGDRFMSMAPAFGPAGSGRAAYGGHVFAQAVYAASKTVPEGLIVQNTHGYFLLPGHCDRPFIYHVSPISEGKSFCTRYVTVRQSTSPSQFAGRFERSDLEGVKFGGVSFFCIVSFKRDEAVAQSHQREMGLDEMYGDLISGDPGRHERCPRVDLPWYYENATETPVPNDFPGLEMRKVDMSSYNSSKTPIDYRQLIYYRPSGALPLTDYNLHACAHLYASDRNSLFVIAYALGLGDHVNSMASLSHSVVFHVGSRDLMVDEENWWCQEAWTPRSGSGRGIHESRIWDHKKLHIATTWQDGLVRRAEEGQVGKQRLSWTEGLKEMGKVKSSAENSVKKSKL